MSLGFRVNNVIYSKSSGKIWSKYKKCYWHQQTVILYFKGILDIKRYRKYRPHDYMLSLADGRVGCRVWRGHTLLIELEAQIL